ncbi:hypothetical protein ARMGADRAFT_1038585 [Armillaria gallica]|uniref:Uncharacterized protein n=1 Tax=Armillaria gallica TaxID=47427 RepID=A0A2H3CL01_ARMGA|nr:hypothetical protein ARMGADRAFT_1038585 [Armillaria gallica]
MPAIGVTNYQNPRTIAIVVIAAFFSTAIITLLGILWIATYDTSRIEEDKEAHAALPFHYIPNHLIIPEPSHRCAYMNPTPPPTPTKEDKIQWDQPMGDLLPATFELPDLPIEPEPSPPYWAPRAEELPRMTTPSTQGDLITSGPNSGTSTERSSDPTEPLPGSSDKETSSNDSSGPMQENHESTWTSTSPWRVATQSWENRQTPAWPRRYMPTRPEPSIRQKPDRGCPMRDCAPPPNSYPSRPTYVPWPFYTRSGLSNRDFEFQFDEETFRSSIRDEGEDPQLYWGGPYPLPDSPLQQPRLDRRRRDQYHRKGTSVLIARAGLNDEQMAEESGQTGGKQHQAQELTIEDRYTVALLQIAQL